MGCNCRKRRMTQTTAAQLAAEQGQQPSSEQVEALVAGAAHTAVGSDRHAGETNTR